MTSRRTTRWRITGPEIDLEREVVLDGRGRRIDDDYVDAVVADVHEQVEVRAGRPSLTGAHAPSPQVTFRLDPQLKALAEAVAASRGTTVSQLAREALERLLAVG